MICSRCNKKVAVVFITKYADGVKSQEGLCLQCAKEMEIQPIDKFLTQSNMSEEDIDALNEQVSTMFEGIQSGEVNIQELMEQSGIDFNNLDISSLMNNNPFALGLNQTEDEGQDDSDDDKDSDDSDVEDDSDNENALNMSTLLFSGENLGNFGMEQSGDEKSDKSKENVFKKKPFFGKDKEKTKKRKFLDTYGINLNKKAIDGGIDKVIGRDIEIQRIIQILNRRAKNNPCLIGEPGVGKTAIAEGLAVRVTNKQVPAKLSNIEIYLLDLTAVVAGTQFRGQFEGRMKGIIEEAKSVGNIVLVIDEIHNIVGAGEAESAMNAANILKPALARGDIQIIGATTLAEYRKHIEKDSALERRFQPVVVDEPTIEESIEILKGIKNYFEDFHRVRIPDEIIKSAVEMSERYINDRFLPDKAIDIIDESGSRANLNNTKLMTLEQDKSELVLVEEELEKLKQESGEVDYQHLADLKVRKCKLIDDVAALEDRSNDPEITLDDVAFVIEAWTKIPVQKVTEVEAAKLLKLEERLSKRVIGQSDAVKSVAKTICRNRSGFKKRKKPASFIFIGPTGVGKTELVRALSCELFETEEALIRLDMSEYMEKHTVSKLIGSPPGYVGYDDAGQLTEKVRRKPYSVILLDEIEKAHPDVFNMLLQILEDGRLTDSHGRVVNFENTIIIMTSNAGAHLKSGALGFTNNLDKSMKDKQFDALKDTFRPEFLNRVDEIAVFNNLEKPELRKIIRLMLKEVIDDAKSKLIDISVTDEAIEVILNKGYDAKYGARPLRREIQSKIEDELSEMFLRGEISEGTSIVIDSQDNQLTFNKV